MSVVRRADRVDPPNRYPDYIATRFRAPDRPPILLPRSLTELTGPLLGPGRVQPGDADLSGNGVASAIGERIIVSGRLLDSDGLAIRDSLVEVWQANAAGRYAHDQDRHQAPLDPNFSGIGRVLSDHEGRFRFTTIKPGAYPWPNHLNAWRPAHIHFSVFGEAFVQRLVTQMYFPGDPLFGQDPIYNSIPDARARERLIARFDQATTIPEWALAYRFDIVVRGRTQTPFETEELDP